MIRLLLPVYFFRCGRCLTRTARVTPRALLDFAVRLVVAALPFLLLWWLVGTFTKFY